MNPIARVLAMTTAEVAGDQDTTIDLIMELDDIDELHCTNVAAISLLASLLHDIETKVPGGAERIRQEWGRRHIERADQFEERLGRVRPPQGGVPG